MGPHPAGHTVTSVSSTSVQQGRQGDQPRAEGARRAWRDPGRLPSFLSGTSSPSRGSLTGNLENVLGPLPKQSTRIPQPAGRRRATGPQGPTLLLSPGAPQDGTGTPHQGQWPPAENGVPLRLGRQVGGQRRGLPPYESIGRLLKRDPWSVIIWENKITTKWKEKR